MRITLDDLEKLEFTSTTGQSLDGDQVVSGIFKVSVPDYVPDGVTVRRRIDPWMFTGSFAANALVAIEKDDKVASVALSQPLRVT